MTRQDFDRLLQEDPDAIWKLVADLAAQVAQLQEKLAPKPHTPSASQPFLKPKSQRPKTDNKTGGQEGHEGHTLQKSATPDEIEQHRPTRLSSIALRPAPGAGSGVTFCL